MCVNKNKIFQSQFSYKTSDYIRQTIQGRSPYYVMSVDKYMDGDCVHYSVSSVSCALILLDNWRGDLNKKSVLFATLNGYVLIPLKNQCKKYKKCKEIT